MSKELKALNIIKNTLEDIQFYNRNVKIDNSIYDLFDTIKQALETKFKKELAWEIAREYKVDIWLLSQCDYENYIRIRKEAMVENELIPKDKYEFLKEMITNEPN